MSDLKRRDFLKLATAGCCGAAIHNVLSPMGGFMAFAEPMSLAAATAPVLVLINLAGGASYNIVPLTNSAYKAKMPTTSSNSPILLNSEQGLHPSLTNFKTIFDEGNLALMNLVGYPNENRSHAESTDIWHSALVNGGSSGLSGWMARAACHLGGFLTTVSMGAGKQLIMEGLCPGKSLSNLSNLGESGVWGSDQFFREVRDSAVSKYSPKNQKDLHVATSMNNITAILAQIQQQTNFTLPVAFPGSGLGNNLRDAARLIGSNLGTRLIYIEQGGYDTHSGEVGALNNLLGTLNAAIGAFANCMKAMGLWDKVIIVTNSEFSRTFENGSAGTDHGHAAPMFVMGGGISGGVKTPAPTSAEVNAAGQWFKDSQIHIDFREVLKQVLLKMGIPSDKMAEIFPEPFKNTVYSSISL